MTAFATRLGIVAMNAPLPMTRQEMEKRGWSECDIVLITGDAYVDHPAFGAALIGRWLERLGYRTGIIAQPDVRRVEDFRALGRPRLFWGITAGNLDSELAQLTVMRKLRRDDAYSPDGRAGPRPSNACITYTACARHAFKGVPVVLGGLEASLRRFAYYDYWTDRVRRSILFDAKADILVYGMGERAVAELASRLKQGRAWNDIPGTAVVAAAQASLQDAEELSPYEEVSDPSGKGRQAFMRMALMIDRNLHRQRGLAQRHGVRWLLAHPPAAPLAPNEMDSVYDLPFTRRPHPVYGRARIPAFDMIRDSITTHRGCFGGCAFCAIAVHQGSVISSRSEANILREVESLVRSPGFGGTISDLGGPTANMYGMVCRLGRSGCDGRSCVFPDICPNLNTNTLPMLRLLRAVRSAQGVKHVFVSSGVRYDLAAEDPGEVWLTELVTHHVGGRLKIAPEHVSPDVLALMRKPELAVYRKFSERFFELTRQAGKNYELVEYFISGHPGCTSKDMIELAQYMRQARIKPEQVQDYYPAPLTLSAAMYYTGLDPRTLQPIPVARSDREKADQRALLLCHLPEFQRKAREALRAAGRADLIGPGPNCLVPEASRMAGSR